MKRTSSKLTNRKKLILKKKCKKLRRIVLQMIFKAGSGHPGGSLSSLDLLVVLFDSFINKRNHFILSKGHAAPGLYAVLADQKIIKPHLLNTLRQLNSPLQGHPDSRFIPQVNTCTGSLGQGISVAVGMALANKLKKRSSRIFTLLGDGEINEGQVWEAALVASHHQLDNLTVIIDKNRFQQTGSTSEILTTEKIAQKWRAFNWTVLEINGHNLDQIFWGLEKNRIKPDKPTVIIANTVKGKGVSFMENNLDFHGRALNKPELNQALKELTL